MSGLSVYTYFKPSQVFTCLGGLLCFEGSKNSKSFIQIILCLVIVLLLSAPLSAWAEKTSNIDLIPEGQAWLKAHPGIAERGVRQRWLVV